MALQTAQKSVQATGFKFLKQGDTIKGYYQGQVQKTINGSPAIEHTYKTPNGVLSVLGQANILNQFKNNGVVPGTYVEITFSGKMEKLKNGRTMKVYDVKFDLDDSDTSAGPPTNDVEWEGAEESNESAEENNYTPPTAKSPSSDSQARVQALLNKGRAAKSA